MLCTTRAIVLSKLKYRDNDLIVKCYTKQLGVVGFLIRGALKSKKSGTKTAYFQLLSQLQITFNYNPSRSLHSIKEVRPHYLYGTLHSHVLKSAVVLFLSEVLTTSLREEENNEELYSYLETALQWFDIHTEYSNFHLLFLLKFSKYLGFYPEEREMDLGFFNLMDGTFTSESHDKYTVSGENLILLKRLLGTTFDALDSIKISASRRQSFLSMMLLYFELHLGGFKTPKSLQVFNQVFN
ncbi:DNA repair protein RecO [Hyunsoonleella sp. SJ7]|uniref:DNA repair protein RecO n=1 Tax=Hyunsoonleella aquatilis TaxID=2762758 RepID=A0A923H8L3_9FLAO|nr:DNA repair protein RecO [Hyunsoonleella aquatilis]MBC3756807.1 DNA repair protein RecO [Hyunsoonleella aquatilis]